MQLKQLSDMRWKRSSHGSTRFKLFGRWRRKINYDDEGENEKASRRGGRLFAFLIRKKRGSQIEQQRQLTASEEDLEAWMQMRKEQPRRRHHLAQRNSSECLDGIGHERARSRTETLMAEKLNEVAKTQSLEARKEDENAWKTRLLKQEGDIENLTNIINQLKSQLGKKSAECTELKREVEKLDSLKKGGKNRSSIISQDEAFQTVIFPVQSNRRQSNNTRRRVESLPVSFNSLPRRHIGIQTDRFEIKGDTCCNENCKIQVLKLKRETNSLKVQLAEGEDIILGLELDHDALRKYLTQTELKLQRSEEENESVKRSLEDREKHYKRLMAGYDDRIDSLKAQNEKLSKKVLTLMNKNSHFMMDNNVGKKEVGIQAITQMSFIEHPVLGAEAAYYGQAVKPRRKPGNMHATHTSKLDRERGFTKRGHQGVHKLAKEQTNNMYAVRDFTSCQGIGSEPLCPSSDNSLEYEIKRRNRVGRKPETFEREDSGLETDRSCISADNERNRNRGGVNKRPLVHGEQRSKMEPVFQNETSSSPSHFYQNKIEDPQREIKNFSIWKNDIMSQLSHLDNVIESKHADTSHEQVKRIEKRRSVLEERPQDQLQHVNFRQSWHESSSRPHEILRERFVHAKVRTSAAQDPAIYGSTESTEDDDADDYVYFR